MRPLVKMEISAVWKIAATTGFVSPARPKIAGMI